MSDWSFKWKVSFKPDPSKQVPDTEKKSVNV